jgi:hypothetical protein
MTYTNLCYFCKYIGRLFTSDYGSQLEDYINSRNPKSVYDVEKITKEFEISTTQRHF